MSVKKPGLFERIQMSAGKMPLWNWADNVTVGLAALVVLVAVVAVLLVTCKV